MSKFGYIVEVHSENKSGGSFSQSFDSLSDDARNFIKARAESFRKMSRNPELKCHAVLFKNGTSERRVIEC